MMHLSKFFVQLEWIETIPGPIPQVIVIICLFDILRMVYSGNVGVIKWWNTADLDFRDISFFWLKGQRLRYTMQFFLQLATQFCIQDL